MTRVIKHAKALRDLAAIALYIGSDSSETALLFLDHAERTIEFIAKHPRAARQRRDLDPPYNQLRSRLVDGFPNYIIFYHVTTSAVAIVRVLHAARDQHNITD